MTRLLTAILALFSALSIAGAHGDESGLDYLLNQVEVIEANDAGEVVYGYAPKNFLSSFLLDHKFYHFERSFEDVVSVITGEVEDSFELFLLVNLASFDRGDKMTLIPGQHMQILRKEYPGQKIFLRNRQKKVVGIRSGVPGTRPDMPALQNYKDSPAFPVYLPVSSGNGSKEPDPQHYVNTFSGVFRLNHEKSFRVRRQSGMYDSLFVDQIYPWEKVSGIAIHGTPWSQDALLGTRQSHGCVRISRNYSRLLYDYIMSPEMWDDNLVSFSQEERLGPLEADHRGRRVVRPGAKVLMVFFEGHE